MTYRKRERQRRADLLYSDCTVSSPTPPGCVMTIGDAPRRAGGRIAGAGAVQMVRLNASEVHRLAEYVERMVPAFGDPPAWVHDKLSQARGDLQDVARYLRGGK